MKTESNKVTSKLLPCCTNMHNVYLVFLTFKNIKINYKYKAYKTFWNKNCSPSHNLPLWKFPCGHATRWELSYLVFKVDTTYSNYIHLVCRIVQCTKRIKTTHLSLAILILHNIHEHTNVDFTKLIFHYWMSTYTYSRTSHNRFSNIWSHDIRTSFQICTVSLMCMTN